MTLDERKRKILQAIIKDYVETAEPVGSRAVVRKHDLKISAATVRNEMADLEEMGYLEQPHTSAGRIPSQMGFRYYVDCMMENEEVTEVEVDLLQRVISENIEDWEDVISNVGNFLSHVTSYTSFIIIPSVQSREFRNLQLIPLGQGKALVLLVTNIGLIMHRKIDIPPSVTPQDLEIIGRMFNRSFAYCKLGELTRSDLQRVRDELHNRRKVIDSALEAIDLLLEDSGEEKVIISGALNILNEPEFKDLEKLKRILHLFEEEVLFKNIVPAEVSDEVEIRIGQENMVEDLKEMSLVLAGYKSFGEMGKIGLIGPVRMEYWKAAGTLETVRKIIEDLIAKRF